VPEDTCAAETAEQLTGDLQTLARRNSLSEDAAVALAHGQKRDREEKDQVCHAHLRRRLSAPTRPGALKRMKQLQRLLADGPHLLVDTASIEETKAVAHTHHILHLAMDTVPSVEWHLTRTVLDALYPQQNGKPRAVSTEAAHRRALLKKLTKRAHNVLITLKTGYTAHHYRKILTLFDTMKTQDVSSDRLLLYGTEIAVCEQGVEGWLRTVAKANEEKNEKRTRRKK
jgi:hypothetical protein